MKKFFYNYKAGLFVFAIIFLASILALPARAADEIDVEYPVGTNISGDDIFNEDNIYPGWSESKTIRVENESATDDTNLYFTFDVNGDKKLSEKLKLYVVRVADNSYRIGGTGDRWDLEEADDESMYVDNLSAGESEQYRIKIKFDEDAGNEYQGLETDLDIDFTIESEDAGSGTEEEILASQGRADFTGNPPAEEVLGEATVSEENKGLEGAEGVVAGEAISVCAGWPLWVWILILVIYFAGFNFSTFNGYREARRIKLFGPLVWTVAVFLVWYFYDKCRFYGWFPYTAGAVGVVSFWYYRLFNK